MLSRNMFRKKKWNQFMTASINKISFLHFHLTWLKYAFNVSHRNQLSSTITEESKSRVEWTVKTVHMLLWIEINFLTMKAGLIHQICIPNIFLSKFKRCRISKTLGRTAYLSPWIDRQTTDEWHVQGRNSSEIKRGIVISTVQGLPSATWLAMLMLRDRHLIYWNR